MSVSSLGYVRVEATDLARWRKFGVDVIGLMAGEVSNELLYLRSDERPFRFAIHKGAHDRFVAAGWELPDARAFETTIAALKKAGIAVAPGSDAEADARCVNAFATCKDPSGNVLELYYGRVIEPKPFVSPAGVSGFIGGDLGMGHVVLPAMKLEETRAFYKQHLGFDDTDEIRVPLGEGSGASELRIYFLHCANRRHHSIALIPIPAPSGLVHAMLEARTVDDVGCALDRCYAEACHISSTFGRHSNDFMLSFYVQTPGGFDLEFGCDGLMPDWKTWVPTRTLGPSLWGHRWAAPPQV